MKGTLIQVFVTIIISLGNFLMGFCMSWPSYALEHLESDLSPVGQITKNEGNLIASILMLGCLVATPISGWMSDAIGRKRSEILITLCFVLAWSISTTAKTAIFIIISRIILGFASGAHAVICVPVISEISTASTRGPLMSITIFCYTLGFLASYIAGWLLSYESINYLCLTLSVVYVLLIILCMKETPVYLIMKKDNKEALMSLKYYRGASKPTQEVLEEFNYLVSQNDSNSHTDKENCLMSSEKEKLRQEESKDQEMSAWKTLCTSKPTQRALVITTTNISLMVFCGTVCVIAYAGPLFSIGAPGLSKHICSIVLSISFVLGSLLSTVASGVMGRRVLHISSAALSSITLAVLASLLRWYWAPEWLVPATVLAFSFFFQVGVASVSFVQMGEIFLPKVKNLVAVLITSVLSITNFVVIALYSPTVEFLGLDGTFLIFSGICALSGVFAYFTMRETKGLPVEDILKMYEKGYLYRKYTNFTFQ